MTPYDVTLPPQGSSFLRSHSPVLGTVHSVGSVDLEITRLKQSSHQTTHATASEFVISNGIALDMSLAEMDAGYGKVPLANKVGATLIHPARTSAEFRVDGDHVVQVLIVKQAKIGRLFNLADSVINDAIERLGYRQIADPIIFKAMNDIWKQTNLQGSSASLMVDGLMQIIMSRILHHSQMTPTDPGERTLTDTDLKRVADFLEAHISGIVTLDMLASCVDMPAAEFAGAFERTTGDPPHRYLLIRRLLAACELLLSSDLPLENIGKTCGFTCLKDFNAVFEAHVGEAPSLYRARRFAS